MEKDATTKPSTTSQTTQPHTTYLTEAELASYQASWEQLENITARQLEAAKGMPFPRYSYGCQEWDLIFGAF